VFELIFKTLSEFHRNYKTTSVEISVFTTWCFF